MDDKSFCFVALRNKKYNLKINYKTEMILKTILLNRLNINLHICALKYNYFIKHHVKEGNPHCCTSEIEFQFQMPL